MTLDADKVKFAAEYLAGRGLKVMTDTIINSLNLSKEEEIAVAKYLEGINEKNQTKEVAKEIEDISAIVVFVVRDEKSNPVGAYNCFIDAYHNKCMFAGSSITRSVID